MGMPGNPPGLLMVDSPWDPRVGVIYRLVLSDVCLLGGRRGSDLKQNRGFGEQACRNQQNPAKKEATATLQIPVAADGHYAALVISASGPHHTSPGFGLDRGCVTGGRHADARHIPFPRAISTGKLGSDITEMNKGAPSGEPWTTSLSASIPA
jgi:hypothetical protein